jgi:hypothetical protein
MWLPVGAKYMDRFPHGEPADRVMAAIGSIGGTSLGRCLKTSNASW